jgi:hypothetical protein
MTRLVRYLIAIVVALAPALASAQPPASQDTNIWARGTELGLVGAVATDAGTTGAALGGSAGWEINRWIGVEGRGMWLDRGAGADAFAADVSGVFNLVSKRRATPFLVGGAGLYHAAFDTPGAPMSSFYRRRLGPTVGMPRNGSRTFNDPSLRLGGGMDLLATRTWSIRPELSILFVYGDGDSTAVYTAGVRFAYRFEDRRVTPGR